MGKKFLFLSGLNGIRAIAAFGVIISHLNLSLSNYYNITDVSLFGVNENGKNLSWVLGEHGVTMFFVLSGFLITFLLVKEFEKTAIINIKSFYVRRILRIWPLYYLYLLITCIVLLTLGKYDLGGNIFYFLFYMANIPFGLEFSHQAVSHFWSIGVEEQFYTFWPLLFLLAIRRNKLIVIVSLLILVLVVFRIFIWYKFPFSTAALFLQINRFDCMLVGGLGAYLYLKKAYLIKFIDNFAVQVACWFIMLLVVLNKFEFLNSIIETFVITIVTLFIIVGQINIKHRVVNLEFGIFSYLGKLSFGIYVYHPLIMLLVSLFLTHDRFDYINPYLFTLFVYSVVIGLTIIISHLSYYHFEKRFLKLKTKFSIIHSSNSKQG